MLLCDGLLKAYSHIFMFSCMFVNTVMALITLFLFYFFTVDVDGGVTLFVLVILYLLRGKKNLNEREIQANVGTRSSHHHTVFHSSIPILLRGTFNMLIEI